jgi:hypothetical protein
MGMGVIGRADGRDLDWVSEVRIDLENEPSGVATAAFEAAPFAVYDAAASKIVSSRWSRRPARRASRSSPSAR